MATKRALCGNLLLLLLMKHALSLPCPNHRHATVEAMAKGKLAGKLESPNQLLQPAI